jgi:hypothetical protein
MTSSFYKKIGLFGIVGPIISILIITILGIYQSDYNHLQHTISALAVGEWGILQKLNFALMAIFLFLTGIALGKSIYKKTFNPANKMMGLFSISLMIDAIFNAGKISHPVNVLAQPAASKIHFISSSLPLLFIPFLAIRFLKEIKSNSKWQSLSKYTNFTFTFCFILGVIWFLLKPFEFYYPIRGIFQKIVVLKFFIWVIVINKKLLSIKTT